MNLSEVVVDIVVPEEQARFRALMQAHHYLGALPKIGETPRQIHSDFGHELSALDDGPAAVVGVLAGVGPPDVAAIVRPIGVRLDSGAGHGVIRA